MLCGSNCWGKVENGFSTCLGSVPEPGSSRFRPLFEKIFFTPNDEKKWKFDFVHDKCRH